MLRHCGWALLGMCVLAGCAGLTARKVPVQARLSEADGKVRGFRYYLSRPYIVVSKAVSLGYEAKVGTLGYLGDDRNHLVLSCPGSAGTTAYFRTNGDEIADMDVKRQPFTPLTRAVVAAGAAAGAPSGPGSAPAANPQAPNTPDKDQKPDEPQGGQAFPGKKKAEGRSRRDPLSGESGLVLADSSPSASVSNAADASRQLVLTDDSFPIIPLEKSSGISLNQLAAFQESAAADNAAQSPESCMTVVMLPDFEEQMAIDDCNGAAYSTYSLRFKNGWQLTTVNGSWDATAVPVDILKVLGTAIGAANDIKLAQLKAKSAPGPTSQKDVAFTEPGNVIRAVLVRREVIAPGMYKLLKPEEQAGGGAAGNGGYLSDLGIPSQFEVTVKLITAD